MISRDIRDIIDLGITSITDDRLVAAHHDLTTAERLEVCNIRLLQLMDIVFDSFQSSPDIKTADLLLKMIPAVKRELGSHQETAKEDGDSQLADFLANTYMSGGDAIEVQ